MELTTQAEPLDQLAVTVVVFRLQIVKQLAALVDHLQKALTAMVIFLVLTEVLGEFCNSLGKQRDLDLGGTGVALAARVLGDDLCFCLTGK